MVNVNQETLSPCTEGLITCDLEGRVESFSAGAEQLLGYTATELVGVKRLAFLVPGRVALSHVNGWLTEARADTVEVETALLSKHGGLVAVSLQLTPRSSAGEVVGVRGEFRPLAGRQPDEVLPPITVGTRLASWLVITRAPFLTAALIAVLIGAAWSVARGGAESFAWGILAMVALGTAALQVAANTFNDYFDWQSGTDQANNAYFQPFSGGSRSIELRLITPSALLSVGLAAVAVAVTVGAVLVWLRGPWLLAYGAAGLFSAYFYTAPPLRLVARRGLGELLIGINFGPLIVAGTAFCLTGTVSPMDFVAGLPIGLLTTAILWVNQFPDAVSDEATGKRNLVVVLGKRAARWGYVALWVVAFGTIALSAILGWHPVGVSLALLALPLAFRTTHILVRHYDDRELVSACSGTIRLQLVTGLLMAIGLRWSSALTGWLL